MGTRRREQNQVLINTNRKEIKAIEAEIERLENKLHTQILTEAEGLRVYNKIVCLDLKLRSGRLKGKNI